MTTLLVGLLMFVCYYFWISNLVEDDGYANYNKIGEHLSDINWESPHEKTDANLVWMMRSREYRNGTKDEKHCMRVSWAKEYADRKIGEAARVLIGWGLFVIPIGVMISKHYRQ